MRAGSPNLWIIQEKHVEMRDLDMEIKNVVNFSDLSEENLLNHTYKILNDIALDEMRCSMISTDKEMNTINDKIK